MEHDTGFTKLAFPASAKMTDEVAASADRFRELRHDFRWCGSCEAWEASAAPERNERDAERVDLVDSLGKAIRTVLQTVRVIPLRPRRS
jgi:hypothetical protein